MLPNEKRCKSLTNHQWVILYKIIVEKEREEFTRNTELLANLLGLKFNDKIAPLTAFINPEMFKQVVEKVEEEENIEEIIGEDISEELENIFETEIDALISEEDKEKINKMEESELRRIEDMFGVKREE